MRRDAAQRRRVFVVHQAAALFALRCVLGRRDARQPLRRRPVAKCQIRTKLAIAPPIALRPPKQLPIRLSQPAIGAAMIERHEGPSRLWLPLLVLLLLGVASAFAVPIIYDTLVAR